MNYKTLNELDFLNQITFNSNNDNTKPNQNHVNQKFLKGVNKHAPLKHVPYINKDFRKSLCIRNRLRNIFRTLPKKT